MKTVIYAVVIAFALLTTIHVPAFATETGTMFCQGGIISIGDSAGEVISKCGQAISKTYREQKDIEEGSKGSYRTITTTVVEDWLYNFGPNQFQYQLLFANGRVAKIESLDYGY